MIKPRPGPLPAQGLMPALEAAQQAVVSARHARPLLLDGAAALTVLSINNEYAARGSALNIIALRRAAVFVGGAGEGDEAFSRRPYLGRAMTVGALLANYRDRVSGAEHHHTPPRVMAIATGGRAPRQLADDPALPVDFITNTYPGTGYDAAAARAQAVEDALDAARARGLDAADRERVVGRANVQATRAEYAHYADLAKLVPDQALRQRATAAHSAMSRYTGRPGTGVGQMVRDALANVAASVYARVVTALALTDAASPAGRLIDELLLPHILARLGGHVAQCVAELERRSGAKRAFDPVEHSPAALARYPGELAAVGAGAVALGLVLSRASLDGNGAPAVVLVGEPPAAHDDEYYRPMIELALGSGVSHRVLGAAVTSRDELALAVPIADIIRAWPALFRGSVLPPDHLEPARSPAYYRLALTLAQTDADMSQRTAGLPVGRDTLFALCAMPNAMTRGSQLHVHIRGDVVYVWVPATGRVFLMAGLLQALEADRDARDELLRFAQRYDGYGSLALDGPGVRADVVWRRARFGAPGAPGTTLQQYINVLAERWERANQPLPPPPTPEDYRRWDAEAAEARRREAQAKLDQERLAAAAARAREAAEEEERARRHRENQEYMRMLAEGRERARQRRLDHEARAAQQAQAAREAQEQAAREAQEQAAREAQEQAARAAKEREAREAYERTLCSVCKERPAAWVDPATGRQFCDVCRPLPREIVWRKEDELTEQRTYVKGSKLPLVFTTRTDTPLRSILKRGAAAPLNPPRGAGPMQQ